MKDFLVFRRMVTPILIQIVFWVVVIIAILGGLDKLLSGPHLSERVGGLAIIILGPLVARVYAEMLILIFKINETVTEIKNNTERQ